MNINQVSAAIEFSNLDQQLPSLVPKFLIIHEVTAAMDTIKPRVNEHDLLILQHSRGQSICTCDGSLPQTHGKSILPTCVRCGGRILQLG